MKVRDPGAWCTFGCGLQRKTGSRFPILFQVCKLLHVYYGPLGRRWHVSALSIYILYTQPTILGLQKKKFKMLIKRPSNLVLVHVLAHVERQLHINLFYRFLTPIFYPYNPIYGGKNLTKLFDWCKHQPPDLNDRTDRGLNLSSAFQRYTSVNAASEVIEVAGSNHAIRVFLNLAKGPNNLFPSIIWSWRIRGDSQPFRLVSCQKTLSFRTFVSASANNKRVVRGPQNYFMSAKILQVYYRTSGRSWYLSAI